MKRFYAVILMSVCLSFVLGGNGSPALAQEANTNPGTPSASTGEQPVVRNRNPQALAQLMQKIERVKYEKITKRLHLDSAQARNFFELYRPAEQEIQSLAFKRNQEIRKLNRIFAEDAKNDENQSALLDATLTEIHDLTQQIESRQLKLEGELKPILTPRQRAELLVFEQEFNKKVLAAVSERRLENRLLRIRKRLLELRKQRQKLKEELEKQ